MKYTVWLNKSGEWKKFKDIDFGTLFEESGARIESNAWIGSNAWIESNARIESNAWIGSGARIGSNAWIESNARIESGAWIGSGARIGSNAKINGKTDVVVISNLGSRNAPMTAYLHEGKIRISTGCYLGEITDFKKQIDEKHGKNEHAAKYQHALKYVCSVLKSDSDGNGGGK